MYDIFALIFLHSVSISISFHQEASAFSLQSIDCNGNVTTLSDCNTTKYDPMECTMLAGVICEGMFNGYCSLTIVHVVTRYLLNKTWEAAIYIVHSHWHKNSSILE